MRHTRFTDPETGTFTLEVPAGFDTHWLDAPTGQVVGAVGSDPPDRFKNYTPLREL